MRYLASRLDFDPDVFEAHGDYLTLAEYYMVEKGHAGKLRSWLDKEWHNGRDIGTSAIHKLIVDSDFPIIYITNHDEWIERAFEHFKKPYHKIVDVGDLSFVKEITQIIKFHGDFEDDFSIVLSETIYFDRLSFEFH